tara:strand:- start:438 stop:1490 length:1053 start_codon:yes stop_codon:yes gene_type:complete
MNKSKKLLIWYNNQSYDFPWRKNQKAYNIWISEIMLQQTQVATVIPYYLKWMTKYPNIKILQKSNIDELLRLWQGLGYYKRVHNIYKSSQIVYRDYNNFIPGSYSDLIKLPGIGDYTASMILSISFKIPEHIPIDGNIKRIMSRVNMISKKNSTLTNYKKYTKKYISQLNPGDSIQALMDIGREICKPRQPHCIHCPLNDDCNAYLTGQVNKFPYKNSLKNIPHYDVVVGMIFKDNQFIISKRLQGKLLENLWELPGGKIQKNETKPECLKREIKEELDIKINNLQHRGVINHQYSHMKLTITLFTCKYKSGQAKALASQEIQWITNNQKKDFAFPRATHKLFELMDKKE